MIEIELRPCFDDNSRLYENESSSPLPDVWLDISGSASWHLHGFILERASGEFEDAINEGSSQLFVCDKKSRRIRLKHSIVNNEFKCRVYEKLVKYCYGEKTRFEGIEECCEALVVMEELRLKVNEAETSEFARRLFSLENVENYYDIVIENCLMHLPPRYLGYVEYGDAFSDKGRLFIRGKYCSFQVEKRLEETRMELKQLQERSQKTSVGGSTEKKAVDESEVKTSMALEEREGEREQFIQALEDKKRKFEQLAQQMEKEKGELSRKLEERRTAYEEELSEAKKEAEENRKEKDRISHEIEEERKDFQEELREAIKKAEELKREKDKLSDTLDETKQKLTLANELTCRIQKEIDELKVRVNAHDDEMKDARATNERLRKELDAAKNHLELLKLEPIENSAVLREIRIRLKEAKDMVSVDPVEKLAQFESLLQLPPTASNDAVLPTSNLLSMLRTGDHSLNMTGLVSIFDIDRGTVGRDKELVINIIFGGNGGAGFMRDPDHDIYLRAMGSMVGLAIGDSMGQRVAFEPFQIDGAYPPLDDMGHGLGGKFNLKPGQWTYDTSMSMCLADSLIMNNGRMMAHDFMHRLLAWCYLRHNNPFRFDDDSRREKDSHGLGKTVRDAFNDYIKEATPYARFGDMNTSGNGTIIRDAPIAICFRDDIGRALKESVRQSRVTHQGDEAAGCCELMTFIIISLMKPENRQRTLRDILDGMGREFRGISSLDCPESVKLLAESKTESFPYRNWDWKSEPYLFCEPRAQKDRGYFGAYCMDAMAVALHVMYHTCSFEEAIVRAVNMRGNSDSIGAVVGQIAGAWYGIERIPRSWMRVLWEWDHGEIALRGYMLSRLHSHKSYVM